MNRRWDVLRTNEGAARLFGFLLGERAASLPPNLVKMMLHPDAVRPYVANWEVVAETLVRRLQREAASGAKDDGVAKLLDEVMQYPGIPQRWSRQNRETPLVPVIAIQFQRGDIAFHFFSTITTLGTPQDITLQEVHIECAFPADALTEQHARRLAAGELSAAPLQHPSGQVSASD